MRLLYKLVVQAFFACFRQVKASPAIQPFLVSSRNAPPHGEEHFSSLGRFKRESPSDDKRQLSFAGT